MYLYTLVRFPPSLFLLRAQQPHLSQPPHTWKMLQSHIHLCGWTRFSHSITFSCWAAQNWTEHFRCGLSSAEKGCYHLPQTAGSTLPNEAQEAFGLLYCWPTLLLYYFTFLMFSFVSSGSLTPFLPKLLPRHSASGSCWCTGLFLPRYKIFHSPLLNFISISSGQFFSLPRFLWMAQPFGVSAAPPSFVLSANLLRVNCSITPSTNETLESICPSISPWGSVH